MGPVICLCWSLRRVLSMYLNVVFSGITNFTYLWYQWTAVLKIIFFFFLYLQALNHRFEVDVQMWIKLVICYLQSSNHRLILMSVNIKICYLHFIEPKHSKWLPKMSPIQCITLKLLHCVMELMQWTCKQCPTNICITNPILFPFVYPKAL